MILVVFVIEKIAKKQMTVTMKLQRGTKNSNMLKFHVVCFINKSAHCVKTYVKANSRS